MVRRRLAVILSLLGLGLSLSILSHSKALASSEANRALSSSEMSATRGAAYQCNNYQCDNGNGCNFWKTEYIVWYPAYKCGWATYGTCTDFDYALCWWKQYYEMPHCPDPEYETTTGSYSQSLLFGLRVAGNRGVAP